MTIETDELRGGVTVRIYELWVIHQNHSSALQFTDRDSQNVVEYLQNNLMGSIEQCIIVTRRIRLNFNGVSTGTQLDARSKVHSAKYFMDNIDKQYLLD